VKLIKRIKSFFRELIDTLNREGSFTRNFMLMASGTAVIVVIQFLFTPVLARIYSPTAYGTFSIYNALVLNLSIAGGLGLSSALMLPKSKRELIDLLRLCFLATTVICLLITLILITNYSWIMRFMEIHSMGYLIFLIPVMALVHGYTQILSAWYIKSGDFKTGPRIRIGNNIVSRVLSIIYGIFVSQTWVGLLSGDLLARFYSLALFSRRNFVRFVRVLFQYRWINRSLALLTKFREFPLYTFPAQWMGVWSGQIPIYLTAFYFSKEHVGLLSFAVSMINLPIALIGYSTHTVFYQRIAAIGANNIREIGKVTEKVLTKLYYLSAIPFSLIIVFGDSIFIFVLGEQWVGAGKIAGFLGLYYFLFLIYSAISSIFTVLKAQKKTLLVQLAMIVVGLLSFVIGGEQGNVDLTFLIYGVSSGIIYLIAIIILLKTLQIPWFTSFFVKFLLFLLTILGLHLIKIMI